MASSSDPTHEGFHHLTLNVQDVQRSEEWYRQVLGFERITGYETPDFTRVILRHLTSGAVIGLNHHNADVARDAFDERRAGLDHVALRVRDRAALGAWIDRFDALAVTHSEVKAGATPGSYLVTFRDPDGIQLEVFAAGT